MLIVVFLVYNRVMACYPMLMNLYHKCIILSVIRNRNTLFPLQILWQLSTNYVLYVFFLIYTVAKLWDFCIHIPRVANKIFDKLCVLLKRLAIYRVCWSQMHSPQFDRVAAIVSASYRIVSSCGTNPPVGVGGLSLCKIFSLK